jgi:transporter family protein
MEIIAGLISMLFYGVGDFLLAISTRKVGIVFTILFSQFIGILICLPYFLLNFSSFNFGEVPQFIGLIFIANTLFAIAYIAFFKGIKEGLISIVSPLAGCAAGVLVILSVIFLKEALSSNQIIAIALIVLGIIFLSVNLKQKVVNMKSGIMYGLIAMLCIGLGLFLDVPVIRGIGWFLAAFLGSIVIFTYSLIYFLLRKDSIKMSCKPSFLLMLFFAACLAQTATFVYNFGVMKGMVSIVTPITDAYPIITVILGTIFFKERLVLNQYTGIIGIIAGLVLISI